MKRRKFIQSSGQLGIGLAIASCVPEGSSEVKAVPPEKNSGPIAICTWGFEEGNKVAGEALEAGESALDAAIKGVAVEESNISNNSVGKGGRPDREGNVTLDACVMDSNGNAGSVVYVKNITNVASLARKVMEGTPHVILAGDGAEQFAYQQGFQKEELLTPESKEAYEEWLKESKYKPIINIENHDTIGMLTMDKNGDIAGACTTSGLAYKMKGRVGDSPIIGSGLYVDNEVGAAAGTGLGEEILKQVGSFLIVELMRNGMSPQKACEEAVMRTVRKAEKVEDFQVCYIAMNKAGETGSYGIHQYFSRMEYRAGENQRIESDYYLKASNH